MADTRFKMLERLFADHAGALQEFFRRRLRRRHDAPDLTQEVYIRMLRVSDHESIENPEAYLFTVANNLLRERAVIERKEILRRVELTDPVALPKLVTEAVVEHELDDEQQRRMLGEAVAGLPERLQAVVVWTFDEGLTQEAIGQRLGVSRGMARKHLAAAMERCRRYMIGRSK